MSNAVLPYDRLSGTQHNRFHTETNKKTINITSKVNIWTVYCWRRDEQKQERLFFETPGKLRPVLTTHNETAIILLQPLGLYLQAWKHFAAMQIENRGFKFYDVAPKTKLGNQYRLLLSKKHPIKLFLWTQDSNCTFNNVYFRYTWSV